MLIGMRYLAVLMCDGRQLPVCENTGEHLDVLIFLGAQLRALYRFRLQAPRGALLLAVAAQILAEVISLALRTHVR